MDFGELSLLLASAIRLSIPLIFAAIAGLYAERAGIFDIGLEGKMLIGAFAAGAAAATAGNPYIGLLCAMVFGMAASLLQGFASINLRGNQLVIGLAINIIAAGLTVFVGIALFARGGQTPSLPDEARFPVLSNEFLWLDGLPGLQSLMSGLLGGQTILTALAFAVVFVTYLVLYRSSFGLRLYACGDKPEALDAAGVSVVRIRYQAMIINGILCGAAGAYLAIVQGGAFFRDMTAGQGFLALAALIFGNWKPVRVLFVCLLFGVTDALQGRLQGLQVGDFDVPVQAIQALPYVLALLLLAITAGKSEAPLAGGKPYTKGQR